jgi:ABC-type multidrug transport system ATPase subunit
MGFYNSKQFRISHFPIFIMTELHVDSIRKTIAGRSILNDVFISCKEGEIVGILGRNGSGKSTLLKIIFGSATADNKFITVDSKKTGSLFSSRNLIHYLPQNNYLPNHIKLKRLISCLCRKEALKDLMEQDQIKPFLDKKAGQLSGGERRIVEILVLLNSNASILLLDEPFHGISPLQVESIINHIKAHSKDKAIIITDHDYENVISVSTRLILMQEGNTRAIKDVAELIEYGYLPKGKQAFI